MTLNTLTPGTPAIAYYRVSRQSQAASGLGLEAQEASVRSFVASRGLEVLKSFTEVETGTSKRKRPVLARAIAETQASGAVLLIAKLDRLTRNVHFISGLLESRVRFIAVDMPDVDNLTVHILAAVAEKEAVLISTRTRDALTAAKVRGVKLGKPENLTREAQTQGGQTRHAMAMAFEKGVKGYAQVLQQQGLSLAAIAERLTADGHRTTRGKPWNAKQVERMLKRSSAA